MTAEDTDSNATPAANNEASRARLAQLDAHLEGLRSRHQQLRERVDALGERGDPGPSEPTAEPEEAAIGSAVTEQVQRARHLRRELAETAKSMARVEGEVAAVLEQLAAASPGRAERLLVLAEQARENAALERARAAEYERE